MGCIPSSIVQTKHPVNSECHDAENSSSPIPTSATNDKVADPNPPISTLERTMKTVEEEFASMNSQKEFRQGQEKDGHDLTRRSSAAVLIQRRVRGMGARASISKRRESMHYENEFLKSLNPLMSPSENATNALLQLASRLNLSTYDIAVINYAVRTLQMDAQTAKAPIILGQEKSDDDSVVKWIREEFTELKQTRRTKPLRLKTLALGVMIPLRLFKRRSMRANMVPDTSEIFAHIGGLDHEKGQQIRCCLDKANQWDWDVFSLADMAPGHALKITCWHILNFWRLVTEFNLQKQTVFLWLDFVESSYFKNPYHNAVHAADVLQTVHYFLLEGEASRYLSKLEILALLLAAVVHDLEHDGKTNGFHKLTSSGRALTHNDKSIQENHHIMTMFVKLSNQPSINILETLAISQRQELRRLMITSVFGTDMSKHFEDIKEFKDVVSSKGTAPGKWLGTGHTGLLMRTLLHLADISNPAKPLYLAKIWAGRVLDEFFLQGDIEKSLGIPVSPQCDREKTSINRSQAGFITFIVLPAFKELVIFLPKLSDKIIPQLESNLCYWESYADMTTGSE